MTLPSELLGLIEVYGDAERLNGQMLGNDHAIEAARTRLRAGIQRYREEGQEADDLAAFCAEVRAELARAEAKWPDGEPHYRLSALAGEVGELAQGYIKGRTVDELRAEAVQVAVTAYRAARAIRALRPTPPEEPKP